MLGVVGKLKAVYCVGSTRYEEIIDVVNSREFSLKGAPDVAFVVDEIRYIEDTIYYVVLSLCGLDQIDDEIVVDGKNVKFDIPQFRVSGNMSLTFFDE